MSITMRECICCQCREAPGDFKDWYQCVSCKLYGAPDEEFTEDPHAELCNACFVDKRATEIDRAYDELRERGPKTNEDADYRA